MTCPRCGAGVVTERAAANWCPDCEWNLALYEPSRRRPELGWAWVDRRVHGWAYRLNERQFAQLAGTPVKRPGRSARAMVVLALGVRRGLLASVPLHTLAALVHLLRPDRMRRYRGFGLAGFAEMSTRLVLAVVCTVLRGVWVLLVWLEGPDGQRAEYLADQLAVQVAGSAATVELLDTMLVADGVLRQVRTSARRGEDITQWRVAADTIRHGVGDRLPRLRQLSRRDDASLFASHPPDGLRASLVESRPHTEPAVLLSDEDARRIDEELATWYTRARHDLANS